MLLWGVGGGARFALKSRHLVGYSTDPATAALQGGMVAASRVDSYCLGFGEARI
ncbi:MAG: hypothetical protein K0A89_04015 [ANME-2 cluster archaeon]|nr:hypothetical protein [ANME-2 cluster archaeon]